jgi:hypothetical protein
VAIGSRNALRPGSLCAGLVVLGFGPGAAPRRKTVPKCKIGFFGAALRRNCLLPAIAPMADPKTGGACNGLPEVLAPHPARRLPECGLRHGSPPSAHPTSPVQAPLTFDIVDSWTGRSLGGCVYHAAHPGGRNYETFLVNSFEAEARRRHRFQDHGHTPGTFDVPPQ